MPVVIIFQSKLYKQKLHAFQRSAYREFTCHNRIKPCSAYKLFHCLHRFFIITSDKRVHLFTVDNGRGKIRRESGVKSFYNFRIGK